MTHEQHIRAICSVELTSRLFDEHALEASGQSALFDYMRQNRTTESAACHIAATHHIGGAMRAEADDALVGAFLASYADHGESLTEDDRRTIAAKIKTFSGVRDDRAALILEYLILLRVDMRDQFAPQIDLERTWAGTIHRQNVSFLGLIHRGQFGSEYVEQVIAGLKTIKDPDELVNHLLFVSEIAPQGHKRILRAFLNDQRMTIPHFTNPEQVGAIARSLM